MTIIFPSSPFSSPCFLPGYSTIILGREGSVNSSPTADATLLPPNWCGWPLSSGDPVPFTFTARAFVGLRLRAWDKSLTRVLFYTPQRIRTQLVVGNFKHFGNLHLVTLWGQWFQEIMPSPPTFAYWGWKPRALLTPAKVLKVREVEMSQCFASISHYYANHMHGLPALTHPFSWPKGKKYTGVLNNAKIVIKQWQMTETSSRDTFCPWLVALGRKK